MTGSDSAEGMAGETGTERAEQANRLNVVSPENLLNPLPLYKELRVTAPVYWAKDVGAWFLTRYDDVMNGFRDPRLSSAARAEFFEQQMQGLGADFARWFGDLNRMLMLNRDGPSHMLLRRQAGPGFSPFALDPYLPVIRQTLSGLLDRVQHQDQMDLVKEVSKVLPVHILSELLGLPHEDRTRFLQWAEPMAEFSSPKPGTDMGKLITEAKAAIQALHAYLSALTEERRRNPGQDMISQMIEAQGAGKMTHEEMVATAYLMVAAGHVTTTDQISNGIHALLSHPDQLQKLREDMSLVKPAVEEMLRFNPAVPFTFRIAVEDIQMRGETIRKGDQVFLAIGAANHDPEVFPEPDRFDITRDSHKQKHLSFAFGPHHCLGAGLARRQLEITTEMLIQRMPGLRLDETKQAQVKSYGLTFRGFESLPVRW